LTNGTTLSSPGLALLFELATTQVKKGTPGHAVLTISIGRPNKFLLFSNKVHKVMLYIYLV
jgi:hypothetical protein